MKHPKQKKKDAPYEIGDVVESPTRNLIGEVVAFLGDRAKSIEVIVLDKRLKPLTNFEGEFKYKRLHLSTFLNSEKAFSRWDKTSNF